jgi:hypothetical protein
MLSGHWSSGRWCRGATAGLRNYASPDAHARGTRTGLGLEAVATDDVGVTHPQAVGAARRVRRARGPCTLVAVIPSHYSA